MAANLPAPPLQTPVVEAAEGTKNPRAPAVFITRSWNNWLRTLSDRVGTAAYRAAATVALTGQSASIALTDLLPVAAAGLYRVTVRIRVTQAATVSSSIQATVTTIEGGVTCTQSNTAYTGNAVNAPQSASFLVRADAGTPISYSTTYASNGATAMLYDVDIYAEAL